MLEILLGAAIDLNLKIIPFSTTFLLGLAALISLLTTLANRRLTDPEKSKTWRREVSDWNKELREAQKSKDKKNLDKVMKKQQHIMQIQSKMMMQSLKVSLLFLVPLLIMWQVLGGFFGSASMAYFPGVGSTLPIPFPFNGFGHPLIWWYLLCSLMFGTVFQHVFRLVEVTE